MVSLFILQIGFLLEDSSCYFIFSSFAAVGSIFILFCVPETRGKSREEVAKLFKYEQMGRSGGQGCGSEDGGRINQGADTMF